MAYLAVDKNGAECISTHPPVRLRKLGEWGVARVYGSNFINLPPGSIKNLIGRELTWDDEPVKI